MKTVDTILIVGCGSIGSRHATNLNSRNLSVNVCDTDTERAISLADDVNGQAFESVDDGIESDPDVVFVCTPTHHHVRPALKAARAGCDLFVEKPLSNTRDHIGELLDAIEKRDLVTMIGCNLRFHPAVKRIKKLLEEGVIGEPLSARIEAGSYLPGWHPDEDYRELYSAKEDIGGALLDFIHELNYSRWFFGEPQRVSAMFGYESSLEIETEDTASVLAEFDTGVLTQFHLDYVQRAYSRSCHIIGEEGTIKWNWQDHAVKLYVSSTDEWSTEPLQDDWKMNDMYLEMTDHFLDCVRSGRSPTSTLNGGARDLAFALAAKESHRTGNHLQPWI